RSWDTLLHRSIKRRNVTEQMASSCAPMPAWPHLSESADVTSQTTAAGSATAQIRAGYAPGVPQNAATTPIYQTVGYEFESFAAARDIFALRRSGNLYSRTGNPTQAVFEERMATLDGGVAALATASGQSAVAVALLTLAKAGEHIVAARQLYGGTL